MPSRDDPSRLVTKLEEKHLPDGAVFAEAIRVKHHFRKVRQKVVRRREGLDLITASANSYRAGERAPLPNYLCLARYGFHRHPNEILASLEGRPFEAPTHDRLYDLCRECPEKQYGADVVFLGTPPSLGKGYPVLRNSRGARVFGSVLRNGSFKPGCWLFALQPTTEEVAEILEKIIQAESEMQEMLAG